MPLSLRAALVLLACAACAGVPENGRSTASSPTRSSMRISREEIASSSFRNAFDLVQAIRPRWLRVRPVGRDAIEQVRVMVGGSPAGGVEVLRQLQLSAIESLEFSDSFDASQHGSADAQYAGTIRVILRRGL